MRNLLILVCAVALTLLAHVTRAPWQLEIGSTGFYGEEGLIFYKQAVELGPSSLLSLYAGYLHLFPRLIALATADLPRTSVIFIYHLSALLAHLALIYAVFRFFQADPRKAALGIVSTIMIPHGGEVFLNLPNTINWLIPCIPLLAMAKRGPYLLSIFDAIILILASLSSPASIVFLPLLIGGYTFLKSTPRPKLQSVLMVGLCGAIQLFFFAGS